VIGQSGNRVISVWAKTPQIHQNWWPRSGTRFSNFS